MKKKAFEKHYWNFKILDFNLFESKLSQETFSEC